MVFNGAKAKRILSEIIHESNLEKVEQKLQKLERNLETRNRRSQDHSQFAVCIYVTWCLIKRERRRKNRLIIPVRAGDSTLLMKF